MLLFEKINLLKEHFTKDERIIIYCVLSLFIPCYLCVIFLLFMLLYLLFKHKLKECFDNVKGSKYLLLFCILSEVTSLIHQNWLGAVLTIAIFVIFCFIIYYMNHTSKELFELLLDIIIFLSIFAAIWGMIEYIRILHRMDIYTFQIKIYNRRENRINSVFYNSNYYGMMLEFFILMGIYKIFNLKLSKKSLPRIIYYSVVSFVNLFMLYLTGCRSAWPALAGGIFVLLLFNHHYKSVILLVGLMICLIIGIVMFPNIFPRVNNIVKYFFTRENIWLTALKALKDNWIIGQGPLTYYHVVNEYGGHLTHHAHSVYIDPFLSHGVLGVACLIPYAYHSMKGCFHIARQKIDRSYLALVLSFICVVLVHGMTDYTIYFVQTSLVFFLVASSYYMYKDKLNDKPVSIS